MAGAALQSFVAATAGNFISHSEEIDEDGKVGVVMGGACMHCLMCMKCCIIQ